MKQINKKIPEAVKEVLYGCVDDSYEYLKEEVFTGVEFQDIEYELEKTNEILKFLNEKPITIKELKEAVKIENEQTRYKQTLE